MGNASETRENIRLGIEFLALVGLLTALGFNYIALKQTTLGLNLALEGQKFSRETFDAGIRPVLTVVEADLRFINPLDGRGQAVVKIKNVSTSPATNVRLIFPNLKHEFEGVTNMPILGVDQEVTLEADWKENGKESTSQKIAKAKAGARQIFFSLRFADLSGNEYETRFSASGQKDKRWEIFTVGHQKLPK